MVRITGQRRTIRLQRHHLLLLMVQCSSSKRVQNQSKRKRVFDQYVPVTAIVVAKLLPLAVSGRHHPTKVSMDDINNDDGPPSTLPPPHLPPLNNGYDRARRRKAQSCLL